MTNVKTLAVTVQSYEGEVYNLTATQIVAKLATFAKSEVGLRNGINPLFRAIAVMCHDGKGSKKEVKADAVAWRGKIAETLGERYARAFGMTMATFLDNGLPKQSELEKVDFFACEAPKPRAESEKIAVQHGLPSVFATLGKLAINKAKSKNEEIRLEGKAYAFLYNYLKQNLDSFRA